MPRRTLDAKASHRRPDQERRASRASTGSLRWLRSLLGRPLQLERRDGQWHVVLADRRRSPQAREAARLAALCAELRARLLGQDDEATAQVMRHLVFVHDALRRDGWPCLAVLPSRVLRMALVQLQLLLKQEPSPALSVLAERLHALQVAAELREERRPPVEGHAAPEVSTASAEEFDAAERDWAGTVAQAAKLPEPR